MAHDFSTGLYTMTSLCQVSNNIQKDLYAMNLFHWVYSTI